MPLTAPIRAPLAVRWGALINTEQELIYASASSNAASISTVAD
jgi:hypothetical protein